MSETQNAGSLNSYHVQVGIAEYTVSGYSEQEAVTKARKKLNEEMPHMSKIISGIMDKHFRVDRLG